MFKNSINNNLINVGKLLNYQYQNYSHLDPDYFVRAMQSSAIYNTKAQQTITSVLHKNHIYSRKYVIKALKAVLNKKPKNMKAQKALYSASVTFATHKVSLSKNSVVKHTTQFVYASASTVKLVGIQDIGRLLHNLINIFTPQSIRQPINKPAQNTQPKQHSASKVGLPKPPKMHMVHIKVGKDDCNFLMSCD